MLDYQHTQPAARRLLAEVRRGGCCWLMVWTCRQLSSVLFSIVYNLTHSMSSIPFFLLLFFFFFCISTRREDCCGSVGLNKQRKLTIFCIGRSVGRSFSFFFSVFGRSSFSYNLSPSLDAWALRYCLFQWKFISCLSVCVFFLLPVRKKRNGTIKRLVWCINS